MVYIVLLSILLSAIAIYAPIFNRNSQKWLFVGLGVILFLTVALRRSDYNTDYLIYEKLYNQAPALSLLKKSFSEYLSVIKVEPTFAILCTLLKSVCNDIKVNFFIIYALYALLGVTVNVMAIKKLSKLEFYSLFIYFNNMFFLHEMTQVRAGVAIGIMMLAIIQLTEGRWIRFIFMILIASCFHSSTSLALILLIFGRFRANVKIWSILFLVCFLVHITHFDIISLINIIPNEYYQYKLKSYILLQEQADFTINFLNIGFLIQNAVIVLCFFYHEKMEEENKYVNILLNMYCLSTCCFLFFGQIPGFATRISEVFNCGQIILIPLIVKVLKPKPAAQLIVLSIGFLYCFINLRSDLFYYGYKTIFSWQ